MWQGHKQSHIPCHKCMEQDRLTGTCTGFGDVYNTKAHIIHPVCKHHRNLFWLVPCGDNAQGHSHHLGTQQSSACTMYMPYTGCGKVINNPNSFATILWSMIDSNMSAQGVEMSTTKWIIHHEGKHHANSFRSVTCAANVQRQNHHFGKNDGCTCICLAKDVAMYSTIQYSSPQAIGLC